MDLLTPIVRQYFNYRVRAVKRYATEFEALQKDTLKMLLHEAAGSESGRRYGYGEIKSYEEFSSRVPVGDYADLKDYIHRMMEGEEDILWPGRVKFFATSSGTTMIM